MIAQGDAPLSGSYYHSMEKSGDTPMDVNWQGVHYLGLIDHRPINDRSDCLVDR